VDSFTRLCDRYYAAMVAIAHVILRDAHLAEDAVQETFAKVFAKPCLCLISRSCSEMARTCA